MRRVNMDLTRIHHVLSAKLQTRIKIKPLDLYLLRRRIRWTGHVVRRSSKSPARMFLFSWVRSPRTLHAPKVAFGLSMGKFIKQVHLPIRGGQNNPPWFRSAGNWEYWLNLVKNIAVGFFLLGMRSGSSESGLVFNATDSGCASLSLSTRDVPLSLGPGHDSLSRRGVHAFRFPLFLYETRLCVSDFLQAESGLGARSCDLSTLVSCIPLVVSLWIKLFL